MTARIWEETDRAGATPRIRVAGCLRADDAATLRAICDERRKVGDAVEVDLDGVTYLDEESAAILRRLRLEPGVSLSGCCLFTALVIDGPEPAFGGVTEVDG